MSLSDLESLSSFQTTNVSPSCRLSKARILRYGGLSAMVRSRGDAGAPISEYRSFPNHNVLYGTGSSFGALLTRTRDCGARSRAFASLGEELKILLP
jgi:hypothetical protein